MCRTIFISVTAILLMDTCKKWINLDFFSLQWVYFVSSFINIFSHLFLVPVTMVLERESTVSCASWREIPFNKFKFSLREQLRHTKFGNGKTKAFGYRRGISTAHLCQSIRGQSCQSPKYTVSANINRRNIRGKINILLNIQGESLTKHFSKYHLITESFNFVICSFFLFIWSLNTHILWRTVLEKFNLDKIFYQHVLDLYLTKESLIEKPLKKKINLY